MCSISFSSYSLLVKRTMMSIMSSYLSSLSNNLALKNYFFPYSVFDVSILLIPCKIPIGFSWYLFLSSSYTYPKVVFYWQLISQRSHKLTSTLSFILIFLASPGSDICKDGTARFKNEFLMDYNFKLRMYLHI